VEGFRQFIHWTIEAAERILCEDLLFGDTERLGRVDLDESITQIRLRLNEIYPGYLY
jgi:hypothetical protein